MNNKQKVILLSSNQPGVGKSTLANQLVSEHGFTKLSFAYPIKELSYSLYIQTMALLGKQPEVTLEEYVQTKKDVPLQDVFSTNPRTQYCDVSLVLTDLSKETLWGEVMLNSLKTVKTPIIIDDWRRDLESDVILETGLYDVIKIFLSKEGMDVYEGNESTQSFEGLIDPASCINFEFKEDWSNTPDIINICTKG